MKRYLTTTLAVLALVIAAGCGNDNPFNEDVPDINIPVDTITSNDTIEDTGDRDLAGEATDTTCIIGFGYAGVRESDEFDADMVMSGTQTRSVPVFYRDCEGDDSDKLVTFELADGEDFCEINLANDYTDSEGIAYGSVSSKQRAGYCHVKACAEDQVDVCVTITVFVNPKGIPPLNVDFEAYDGNYPQINAVKVGLIKQTPEKMVMCADIDPRKMPNRDLESNWSSINEVTQFTSLPGLKEELAQDWTIIAMAYEFDTVESEANPLRAWSCDDTRGHVEYGDMTLVTMKLWDMVPSIKGTWYLDSSFDLTTGLPPTVDKIIDVLIGLFTSPTGQLLLLMCDETVLGVNLGADICGSIFADADDPVLGEYGMIGTFVVGIIDGIIENWLETSCPYPEDPELCSNILHIGREVGEILQKFRIKSNMECEREPRIDWGNPSAGAIIEKGDCREEWTTFVLRWTLGTDCEPSDEECGTRLYNLTSIYNLYDVDAILAADISGAVIDGKYLQIDQHTVNIKYGVLINFALEKILLPEIFGDGSDGLPPVDSYEDLLGSLLAGRQCLGNGSCCSDFGDTIEKKYPGYGLGILAESGCEALIEVAVGYIRTELNKLAADPDAFTIGTPLGDPALLIDNDDNMVFDTIGTQSDKQDWAVFLTMGGFVYDPVGKFWGKK